MNHRVKSFAAIHKAIRLAMSELLVRLGTAEADDTDVLEELEGVLHLCEAHLSHEETFVRPFIVARFGTTVGTFDRGHPEHLRFIAELRELAAGGPSHELYLHYSEFVADAFAHMVEEEKVVQALLEEHFTDAEIAGLGARIVAALPPVDKLREAALILRAMSRPERRPFVTAVLAPMPAPARTKFLDAMRKAVPSEVFADLSAIAAEAVEKASAA